MSGDHGHEYQPAEGPNLGYGQCAKCGALVGSYDYMQPCTVPDTKPETNDFGTADTAKSNPIAEAVRMSAFDRFDRRFKK